MKLITILLGDLIEFWLGIRNTQPIHKLLKYGRKTIIRFVSRSPQRIPTSRGQLLDLQDSIITRNGFEGNIRMPLLSSKTIAIPKAAKGVPVNLGLLRGDNRDFVVFFAEFVDFDTVVAVCIGNGVDVKFGGGGFTGQFSKFLAEGFLLRES